jgi:antitoxin component YwqK of YwqJK toxin-antitoxin module
MIKNRIKKSLHKLKFPQMQFSFVDPCAEPKFKVKGTRDHHLVFYLNEDGSRTQMYESSQYFKHGTWHSWDKYGKLYQILPNDKGQQHGQQIHWYPDGSLKRIWHWHRGLMHGRWMEWYENGVTSFQGHYRLGKKHGKWWEWYENGKMSTAGEFLDGYALDLTVWKPDGTLCPESGVSAGLGYWLSYEDNGDLKSRSEISNGEIVYELPDEFKDIEDDEDDSTDEY